MRRARASAGRRRSSCGGWARAGRAGWGRAGVAGAWLADGESGVVSGQAAGELAGHGDLLGLSETERALRPGLGRGRALWKMGGRSAVVQHGLSPAESV